MTASNRPGVARPTEAATEQMGSAANAEFGTAARGHDPQPEQQPWLTPEAAKGWKVIARGTGRPRPVAVSVLVDFDLERSVWLREESRRTGLSYDELIMKLVDDARAGGRTPDEAQDTVSAAPVRATT